MAWGHLSLDTVACSHTTKWVKSQFKHAPLYLHCACARNKCSLTRMNDTTSCRPSTHCTRRFIGTQAKSCRAYGSMAWTCWRWVSKSISIFAHLLRRNIRLSMGKIVRCVRPSSTSVSTRRAARVPCMWRWVLVHTSTLRAHTHAMPMPHAADRDLSLPRSFHVRSRADLPRPIWSSKVGRHWAGWSCVSDSG